MPFSLCLPGKRQRLLERHSLRIDSPITFCQGILVFAKLLDMFGNQAIQLRWHFNTPFEFLVYFLSPVSPDFFLVMFCLNSCFRIHQFPTEKLDFLKHQFGVLTVCKPKQQQQLDLRFSTTKRAFDDFLRTIRELKKLRCCWDL